MRLNKNGQTGLQWERSGRRVKIPNIMLSLVYLQFDKLSIPINTSQLPQSAESWSFYGITRSLIDTSTTGVAGGRGLLWVLKRDNNGDNDETNEFQAYSTLFEREI